MTLLHDILVALAIATMITAVLLPVLYVIAWAIVWLPHRREDRATIKAIIEHLEDKAP